MLYNINPCKLLVACNYTPTPCIVWMHYPIYQKFQDMSFVQVTNDILNGLYAKELAPGIIDICYNIANQVIVTITLQLCITHMI